MLLRKSTLNVFKPVGIKLNEALQHPGTIEDIILEQGDSVHVPKFVQTVQTTGAVNVPRQVAYEPGMSFLNVIRKSGWFVSNANRRHAYVVRANGEIKTTKRFLVFHFYPKVEPGAEIVIPAKKPKLPVTTAEYIGIGSSIASLAGLIIALINATK
jgi:protein involved in polysaccharide export with SLBB domain